MEPENYLLDDEETPRSLAYVEYSEASRTYAYNNLVMVQAYTQWYEEYKYLNNGYIDEEPDLGKAVDYASNKEGK